MSVLLLTRSDVAALLTLERCVPAVEEAFRLLGEGKARPPGILGIACTDGGFHIKAGVLATDRHYFAAKVNANFPQNPQHHGLPTIQGLVVLSDADTGCPLAVMDSAELTALRTGAATAVAASRLARADATTATICGCGIQGRIQLQAIAQVCSLRRASAFDQDFQRARVFAEEMTQQLKLPVEPSADLSSALSQSDICVTCTPSRQFFIRKEHIRPGTFIAAVGADSHDKQELEPALLASSTVVVDSLEQCASIGELHHAIAENSLRAEQVHAELGQIVAGLRPGRRTADEIIVFDSTGLALQDVAAASMVYGQACRTGRGQRINLAA